MDAVDGFERNRARQSAIEQSQNSLSSDNY